MSCQEMHMSFEDIKHFLADAAVSNTHFHYPGHMFPSSSIGVSCWESGATKPKPPGELSYDTEDGSWFGMNEK